jgi:hypothetical protein
MMSSRGLWALSVPLALLGWIGLIFLTGVLSVSMATLAVVLPVLALALTMTVAPAIWVAASRLGMPVIGERPAVALRVALWFGLWATICIGLRVTGSFSGLIAITLAVIFGLVETFLQQWARR